MKIKLLLIFLILSTILSCADQAANKPPAAATKPASNSSAPATPSTSTAQPTSTPVNLSSKNGDYDGTGTVTKINMELGSIEMDHDDIPNLMPAMRMEFYVSDKAMLQDLKIGDRVRFRLRYKDGTETIVKIGRWR